MATATQHDPALLVPYLPRVIVEWAATDPTTVHRTVTGTLVSADISGFTALSERLAALGRQGAEEVVGVVNTCFDGMIADAEEHGGDVLKFGGDALLILFTGPAHRARALAAAVRLQGRLVEPVPTNRGPIDLSMSIGLHTGDFELFLLRGEHREFVITGPAVTATLAAESEAGRGEVLLTPAAARGLPPDWTVASGDMMRLVASPAAVARDVERPGTTSPLLGGEPCSTVPDLAPFIPASLVPTMRAAARYGEIRPVATTFIAFDGIEQTLAMQGPQEVARQLSVLSEAVSLASQEYGVHWLDTDVAADGGKVHLTAGAPTSTGDDAGAILRTVRAVLDACPVPRLRAGVNIGHVFTGDVGSATRRTFSAMGDSVNLAARLSGKAETGQVVATRHTLAASSARFETVDLEPFLVKGKGQPIEAAVVGGTARELRVSGTEAEARGPEGRPDPTFVGRDEDVEALRRVVAATLDDRRPRTIAVTGTHGAGKSRLVRQVLSTDAGLRVLTAYGDQYEVSTPYHPVARWLREVLDLEADATPERAGRALAERVRRAAPDLQPWLPLLAVPLGATVADTPEAQRIAPAFRRLRLQSAVVDLLRATLTTPTAFVADDLQWFDDASRDLVLELVRSSHDRPWLLFTTSPDPDPDLTLEPTVVTHELEGLDDAAATLLAREVVGDRPVTDRDIARVVERSAGEPLFVIELAEFAAQGGEPERLPATIEEAVTVGIDRLDPGQRSLLRDAAVLGVVMDPHVLADALDQPEVAAAACWRSLAAWIVHDGTRVRFREHLYQEVAYAGLSFARRRELHGRVARLLVERHERGLAVSTEELALHHHRAGDHVGSWTWSVQAADHARDAYAPVEAVTLYGQALEAAEHVPGVPTDDLLRVAESRGDAGELAGRYDVAREAYNLALVLATAEDRDRMSAKIADTYEAAGDQAERAGDYDVARQNYSDAMVRRGEQVLHRARIARKIATVDEREGDYDAALRRSADALTWLDVLEGSDADQARAGIHALSAGVEFRKGGKQEVLDRAQEAIAAAERADSPPALARGLYLRGVARRDLGLDGSREDLHAALEVFEGIGDHEGQAICHNNLGVEAYFRGQWDDAVTHYEAGRRARRAYGDVVGEAMLANNLGEVLSDQGRLEEASEALEPSLRAFRAARAGMAPLAIANVGRLEVRRGNLERAKVLLDEALTALRGMGAAFFVADTEVKIAEWHVHAGDLEPARELLDRHAAPDASGQSELTLEATRVRLLGLLYLQSGDAEAAIRVLDDGLERTADLGEGFETCALLQARARAALAVGDDPSPWTTRAAELAAELGIVAFPVIPTPQPLPESVVPVDPPEGGEDDESVVALPLAVTVAEVEVVGATAVDPSTAVAEVGRLAQGVAMPGVTVAMTPSGLAVSGSTPAVLRSVVRLVAMAAADPSLPVLRVGVAPGGHVGQPLSSWASPVEVVLHAALIGEANELGLAVAHRAGLPPGAVVVRTA